MSATPQVAADVTSDPPGRWAALTWLAVALLLSMTTSFSASSGRAAVAQRAVLAPGPFLGAVAMQRLLRSPYAALIAGGRG